MTSQALAIVAAITSLVPHLPEHEKVQDATQIEAYAKVYNFDPLLIVAVIFHESTFNRSAGNGRCFGLMGLNIIHFDDADNPAEYATNISIGVQALNGFRSSCGDSPIKFLTAYNRGTGKNLKNCKPSAYARGVIQTWESLK